MQCGKPAYSRQGGRRSRLRFLSRNGYIGALTLLVTSFSAPTAFATSPFRFENRRENVNSWRIVPEYWSLSTTNNYDGSGAKAPVPNLNSYKKTQFDVTAIYGMTSKLSLFGRLSMASVTFETTSLTGSGSGLTEQGLGGNYRIWESVGPRTERRKAIDLQVMADIPFYSNVSSRTSVPRQPLRGDGSFDFTNAAFGTLPLNQGAGQRLYLIGGLGLTLRGNGYSNAIPYQIQFVGIPERSGLLYRVGFHGFKSMSSDPAGVTAISPQAQSNPGTLDPQDAAQSLIVDALNSSYLQMRATLGYQWGAGDQVFLTYLIPMSGTSTSAISGFILGAQFRFAGGRESSAAPATPGARPAGKLSYDLQGRVKQANDRLNLIKIDRGENDGVQKGQIFDIYRTGPDGLAADLVARGIVTGVSPNETIVNLRQYKKEVWVQAGFIARRIAPKKP